MGGHCGEASFPSTPAAQRADGRQTPGGGEGAREENGEDERGAPGGPGADPGAVPGGGTAAGGLRLQRVLRVPAALLAALLQSPVPHGGVSLPLARQEQKQRSELLQGLRSEAARLRQLHDAEVRGLQAELEGRLAALQQRHSEKVSSRLCLRPSGLLRDGLGAPHRVPLHDEGQVTLPACVLLVREESCHSL